MCQAVSVETYIETQHNHTTDPDVNAAISEVQILLNQLRHKYPNATDKQMLQTLLNGFEAMPQKNPQNWRRWQDIFSILFAGGIETAKVLVPVLGVPIEVSRRLYEIYDRNRKQLPSI